MRGEGPQKAGGVLSLLTRNTLLKKKHLRCFRQVLFFMRQTQ